MYRELVGLLVLSALTTGIAAMIVQNLTKKHLRKHHPDIWRDLGQPGFPRNSIHNSIQFSRYALRGNDYKSLNDGRLNTLVSLSRLLGLVAGACLALTIAIAYLTHTTH